MRLIEEKYLVLLTLGVSVMSFTFILKRYVAVTDGVDGFLKGIGMGLMIVSLTLLFKRKQKQLQPNQ